MNELKLGFTPAEGYELPMKWLIKHVDELEEIDYLYVKLEHYQKVAELQDEEINRLLKLNKKLSLQIGRGIR